MRKIVPLRAPPASLAAWKSFIAAVESCLVFNFTGLFRIDVKKSKIAFCLCLYWIDQLEPLIPNLRYVA